MNKKERDIQYRPRIIDEIIERNLQLFGALCIEGPKWCGKTWTSKHHSNSSFYVGDPTNNFSNRQLAFLDPYKILEGSTPRLIDERQEVPLLWDAARAYVDLNGIKGKLILTGSSTPQTKGILHTGTGRIKCIRMNNMSLYESGDSNGKISLQSLINNDFENQILENTTIDDLAYLVIRGGWPGAIGVDKKSCSEIAKKYMENVLKSDLKQIDDSLDYNEHKAKLILKSLARNESTTASNQNLLKDIIENDNESISKNTLVKYLNAFERMFLFNNQEPFSNNVRSSLRVKQMEKRHFSDPAMACAMLKLTPKKLINDLNTFGFMFEALVERDLGIYAESLNGKIYQYQDYKNNEIDCVLELEDGNWCAIEIKLGLNNAEEGAANLVKVCNQMVSNGAKEPIIKCVIYGVGNLAYKNKDDVYIIPITALKN